MESNEPQDQDAAALIDRFQEILTGSWMTQALYVAAEVRIADFLAVGPKTSEELAADTGTHAPSLRRLLLALSTIGICRQGENGAFEMTPLGSFLQIDSPQSLRSWTIWWGRHLWQAWGNLLDSVRTGESARRRLHGTEGFEHLDRDPEAASVFYQTIAELTRMTAQALLQAYDFSELKRVVDVGGGYGELLASILKANPSTTGILFDLPRAVEGATRRFEKERLAGRCEFITGDFFKFVPEGGDCYILKSVIHDWDNERSALILGNCRRAMAKGSRLLVIEPILSPFRETSPLQRTLSRHDLTMLVAHGARERTESEFMDLLRDAGFQISRIIPAGPVFNIIEAFPVSSPERGSPWR